MELNSSRKNVSNFSILNFNWRLICHAVDVQ